jgi:hypothetical protein
LKTYSFLFAAVYNFDRVCEKSEGCAYCQELLTAIKLEHNEGNKRLNEVESILKNELEIRNY